MENLSKLSIRAVHEGLLKKDFTSSEVLESCLKEVKSQNKDLNAFVLIDEEGAKMAANSLDAKIMNNESSLSVLSGVPMSLKDIFCVKGMRTTCASKMLENFIPPYDATVVEKLRDNDSIIVGKTNMDEFACGASTEHSIFGPARNPYDTQRVAGGSSGGSAVSVASNMSFYSLGTDTGGSIRQPASLCGVYGLKPTYGRISRSGVVSMASSWDHVGAFARSAEDIGFVLSAIAGKDRRDSTTSDKDVPDYSKFLDDSVKGLKIGIPKEYFDEGVEEETRAVVMESAKKLEKQGAEIIDVSLPYTKYAIAVYYISMPAELSSNLERFDGIRYGIKPSEKAEDIVDYYYKARSEGFGSEIKRRILIGTYVLSSGYFDAYYKKAQKVRTLILEDFNNVFTKVDALLAPVSPFPAFKVGDLLDNPLAMYMADALTIPANAAGVPALSCPVGKSKTGLPIGAQIIAPQFGEGLCLTVANALSA